MKWVSGTPLRYIDLGGITTCIAKLAKYERESGTIITLRQKYLSWNEPCLVLGFCPK